MSAIRNIEVETISGKTTKNAVVRCSPYPISRLHAIAIRPINIQAVNGIRFHQAACV